MKRYAASTIRLGLIMGAVCAPWTAMAATATLVTSPSLVGSVTTVGGYAAPQGNRQAYDTAGNIALNKSVIDVTGTIDGYAPIHAAAFLTDGYFGNGSSWIDNSHSPAGFTIDLGAAFSLNSVTFGRDRLGGFDDRDPGQVTIALSSTNTNGSFATVFDSGSNMVVSGNDGWRIDFAPASARYVRMTFSSAGAAIDEVQVTAVPEPGTCALLTAGLLVLGVAARRKTPR